MTPTVGRHGWPACTGRWARRSAGRSGGAFEASGPDLVRSVNDTAQFPLARVIAVLSAAPAKTSPLADLQEDGPDGRH